MKSWYELLMPTSDVQTLILWVKRQTEHSNLTGCRCAGAINDRCPTEGCIHFFIHKMGLFIFLTSYAQQIQRQTCSKPQTKFLHQSNPASHFKMAPQQSNPWRLLSSFTFWKIVLQQSHFSRMAQATFRILPLFWQIPTSPLNKLHFFFKTTSTGL